MLLLKNVANFMNILKDLRASYVLFMSLRLPVQLAQYILRGALHNGGLRGRTTGSFPLRCETGKKRAATLPMGQASGRPPSP